MSENPGTYATYLWMLHRICHEEHFRGEQRDFDRLVEYGWIKPRNESGVASAEWIARQREAMLASDLELSWWYVLTAKGYQVLAPRENKTSQIPRHNAPNFDFSHKKALNTCWGMHKRVRPIHEDAGYRRWDYSADSETIVNLGKHLIEAVGWMGQSPWDVGLRFLAAVDEVKS